MKADKPTGAAFKHAAHMLRVETRALRALAEVEAGALGAFFDSGEPALLFERHVFHKLTRGQYDGERLPDASLPQRVALISHPKRGGYGAYSLQHRKLGYAATFDRAAALQACSWGLFQIMGHNWQLCGFATLQDFVNAMYNSADDHLTALTRFLLNDLDLVEALRDKRWAAVARRYNGPAYRDHNYDGRLAEAYARAED